MTDDAHVPVLKEEVLGFLEPGPGKRIVDGTFGFGGHSLAILAKGAEVLGLDLDEEAVASELEARGVLILPAGPGRLRAVTHLDVDDQGIDRCLEVLSQLLA